MVIAQDRESWREMVRGPEPDFTIGLKGISNCKKKRVRLQHRKTQSKERKKIGILKKRKLQKNFIHFIEKIKEKKIGL